MKSKIIRLLSIACVILVAIPTTYSRSEEKENERDYSVPSSWNPNYYESNHIDNGSVVQALSINDPRWFRTIDYEEYLVFVRNTELPEHFVEYDPTIKMVGEFCAFKEFGKEPLTYRGVNYLVKDFFKQTISVSLDCNPAPDYLKKYEPIEAVPNLKDMRKSECGGVYDYHGIRYYYMSNGELLNIEWNKGSMRIAIHLSHISFTEYPVTDWTFVGKLLNTETAMKAVLEFNSSIE